MELKDLIDKAYSLENGIRYAKGRVDISKEQKTEFNEALLSMDVVIGNLLRLQDDIKFSNKNKGG